MNQLTPIAANGAEYRQSTDAAGLCREIVKQTAKNIQGRRYVSVEGWQAIAIAHGCTASADQVERVTDEGMAGFKCTGIVRRMSDGAEISRAEGFLGDDERTWSSRPVYARRAMVQTRAISRACRSAFAHVVVMIDAGLSTTPAEEVPHEGFDRETGEIIEAAPEPTKVAGITKIKSRLNALMSFGNAPMTLDEFNALVREYADDLTKIKEANHAYWTGDGEDSEGFKAWIVRRRNELAEPDEESQFSILVDSLNECETKIQLQNWLATHGDAVEALDGEESRKFEMAYQLKESIINEQDRVTA